MTGYRSSLILIVIYGIGLYCLTENDDVESNVILC